MTLELRPYQRAAIDETWKWLSAHDGSCIVVIPTGGGKSLIMAQMIMEIVQQWPDERILVVTHVRELVQQNYDELMRLWPFAPAGIYSAGLKRRDKNAKILFASIQSIHEKAYELQQINIILCDEAHLVPRKSDTMYRRFFDDVKVINGRAPIIGLTASPFRLDSGMLTEGDERLFDGISYEAPIIDLIDRGWLAPIVSKAMHTKLDVTGVATRGGEFVAKQLQDAVDKDEVTAAAVAEIVDYGRDRRSWLAFCTGVEHAYHVRDQIRGYGFSCETVVGNTPAAERDQIIAEYKQGKIRCLTGADVLTTGFNAPAVDLIAMLRPTKSAGLFIQICGRGMRTAKDKENCLLLDFADNLFRFGPIDKIKPRPKGKGDGEAPVKECPQCNSIVFAGLRQCPDCGHMFPPPELKIAATASALPVLSSQIKPEWLAVDDVAFACHRKAGKPDSLKVRYRCGLTWHTEWICLQHTGYPRTKAESWWRKRTGMPIPATVDDALRLPLGEILKRPAAIKVRPEGKFTEILDHQFAESEVSAAAG